MTDQGIKEQLSIMRTAIYQILKSLEADDNQAKFGQLKTIFVSKMKDLVDET